MSKIKVEQFVAKIDELTPTENNPRQISKQDFENLKKSMKEFPEMREIRKVVVDENNRILGGHMRIKALKELGESEVPVDKVYGLTEKQKERFVIQDNIQNGEWDWDKLANEWSDLSLDDWGLDVAWGKNQTEYQDFVDKFKPKLTTDDCYTPPEVFEAVEKWVRGRYRLDNLKTIRPFKPNGDYESEDYSDKVVIDNPPFSILSEIVRFYSKEGVKYFLFAPQLTILGTARNSGCAKVIADADVIYENGANVRTSFVTNLENDNVEIVVAGSLKHAVESAQPKEINENERYKRPKNVLLAMDLQYGAKNGNDYTITKDECCPVANLDELKKMKKGLYGTGILVNDKIAERAAAERAAAERAAAERAAAERAAAERAAIKVELSERELAIVAKLNEMSERSEA